MFYNLLILGALALATALDLPTPCPGKQGALQASALQWPRPTGDLSSYISSFSSANNGIFSGCSKFTSEMPASLTSPYQAWVTSVGEWSTSLESTIQADASTCNAFVVNIVIATPLCPDNAVASASGSTQMISSASSSTSSGSTPSATTGSSGAPSITTGGKTLPLAMSALAVIFAALAILL